MVETAVGLNLWLEGAGIPVKNAVDRKFALVIIHRVRAPAAVALGSADLALSEAVAVKLQALAFLAVTSNRLLFRSRLRYVTAYWLYYFSPD